MQEDALLFAPSRPVKWFQLDGNHSDTDGNDTFVAKNPAHGATLTYYLKESLLTSKEKRQAAEEKALEENNEYPKYPSWEAVEAENLEPAPAVYLEITDSNGEFVDRVEGSTKKGVHRVTWDMNYANTAAVVGQEGRRSRGGLLALPGAYSATLFKREGTTVTQLTEPVDFVLESIYEGALEGASAAARAEYDQAVVAARKQAITTTTVLNNVKETMALLREAIDRTPGDIAQLEAHYGELQAEINAVNRALYGLASRDRKGAKPANIMSRLGYASSAVGSSYGPTQQHREQLGFANEGLDEVSQRVKVLQETRVPSLQQQVVDAGGPWTPGLPVITE